VLHPRFFSTVFGALAAATLAIATAGVAARAGGPQADSDATRLLAGAIDIHVHTTPDDRPRSVDAIEVARLAHTRGMRAIVLKNHYESTAGIAFLVRTVVPDMQVFGGIDLNLTVGGMNPAAVEHMTKVSGGWGRIVWMSTFDAENQVRFSREDRPFVRVVQNGALLPEVKSVIALIAKHGLVLATGHTSPAEAMLLLEEGRRGGVRAMVVTHAMNTPVSMTVEQMQQAARLGAFIEFVGGSMRDNDADARVTRFASAIRAIGPASCILSSDLGQANNPVPPDGFGAFLSALRAKGIADSDIVRMSKENPARLLGLQ
jgi:hypothetical protein